MPALVLRFPREGGRDLAMGNSQVLAGLGDNSQVVSQRKRRKGCLKEDFKNNDEFQNCWR